MVLPLDPPRIVRIDIPSLFETLSKDFSVEYGGTVYVRTGDIPAMWLRDSSAQALPYVRFASALPRLAVVLRGVIERNARNVLTDAYANAFTAGYKIWEEKWEVDSLAYPVCLAWVYLRVTGDRAILTPHLHWALKHTLDVYECEQHHDTCPDYTSAFLANHGRGALFADTGMIWGAFRPSDDPVRYPFNIPQQMFAIVALDQLADLEEDGYGDMAAGLRARQLAAQIRDGIERYGKVYDFRYGWIYAYEVDGLGNVLLMDDANLPNLISATYFGFTTDEDEIYQNTRRFVLSDDNQFFYRGAYAAGLGSPHTPTGWIWPLGIVTRALTARSRSEVAEALAQLRAVGGPETRLHESADPDHPWRFTRTEFGWVEALYAELLFRAVAGLPAELGSAQTPRLTSPVEAWQDAATVYRALSELKLP